MIKSGHPAALTLLGSGPDPHLDVTDLQVHTPTVTLGGSLRFSFTLSSSAKAPIRAVVDYVIHHRRANGSLTPKVFKLSTRALSPGDTVQVTRTHPIRLITTRRYYTGEHRLEIQVNGLPLAAAPFDLLV